MRLTIAWAAVLALVIGSVAYASTPGDISTCQTLDTSGTYNLVSNVVASGTCFTVTAANVTIDCAGTRSITYADSTHGNAVYSNASGTTVQNCTITKGGFAVTSSVNAANGYAVWMDGSAPTVQGNTITVNNSNTSTGKRLEAIRLTGSGSMTIFDNDINVDSSGATVKAINADGVYTGSINENRITWASGAITDNTDSRPAAIDIINSRPVSGTLTISGNTIDYGDASTSSDEIQAIQLWESNDLVVKENTITLGGTNPRGISAHYTSDLLVHNNTITHRGSGGRAMRMRYADSFNQDWYDNYVDASASTGSASCLAWGDPASAANDIAFYRNTFIGGERILDANGYSSDFALYNNTWKTAPNTSWIWLLRVTDVGATMDDIRFSYEEIVTTGGGGTTINISDDITNVAICGVEIDGVAITSGDISNGAGVTITSSSCAEGSSPAGTGGGATPAGDAVGGYAGISAAGVILR